MTSLVERYEIVEALGGDDPEWVAAAFDAVERVALRQPMVTTDDLWPLVTFPRGQAGGRAMGKVIRWALAHGVIEKATSGSYLLCLDHATLDPIRTLDGALIRHQGPLVVYQSLRFDPNGGLDFDVDWSRSGGLMMASDRSVAVSGGNAR